MIRINLQAARKKGGKGAGTQADVMSQLRSVDVERLRQLPLLKIILPIVCIYLGNSMLETWKEEQLTEVARQQDVLRADQTKLQKAVNDTRKYDEVKKQLEQDEELISSKLKVVKKLVEDRRTPPLLMSSIAKTIPSEVWLTEMRIGEKDASFRGSSVGFNPISDFMQNLTSNIYFGDVALKSSQQVRDDRGNEIASFELSASRR